MDLFTLWGLVIVGVASALGAAIALLVDPIAKRFKERRTRKSEADADQSGTE